MPNGKKKAKQCRDCRAYFSLFGARRLNTCNDSMRSNQFSASLVPRIGKVAGPMVQNRTSNTVHIHSLPLMGLYEWFCPPCEYMTNQTAFFLDINNFPVVQCTIVSYQKIKDRKK